MAIETAGRVALITGASAGIGAATARLGARRGYAVCVNYLRNREAAQGVGEATTRSVVVASVVILSSDFFMTKLLLAMFPVV